MHKLHRKFLLKKGWFLDKESPIQIRNEDGSIATGIAAQCIINKLQFPKVITQWYHPILDLTCEELLLESDKPSYFECVWQPHPTLPYGEKMTLKPYFDKVRVGDYWVFNGNWWGRKEKDGFRVLATHNLVKCDNSLWERKEILEKYLHTTTDEWMDDDIPF